MKEMSQINFNISLYVLRSNPVICRDLSISWDMRTKDLTALSLISLGAEPDSGRLFIGEAEIKDGRLKDTLKEGDDLKLLPEDPEGKGRKGKLICHLHVNGTGRESANSLPYITMAAGAYLPEAVWDIKEINHILLEAGIQGEFVAENGMFYSSKALRYSEKKTDNSIRKYFAPGTERKELQPGISMPMSLMLDKLKLNELKAWMDHLEIYTSGSRKADRIAAVCHRIDGRTIERVFRDMGLSEFNNFRSYVLNGKIDGNNITLRDLFPVLRENLLAVQDAKSGIIIAREAFDYYDEWYGTDTEDRFIKDKILKTAMKAAGALYGVFGQDQFLKVLGKIADGKVRVEEAEWYFANTAALKNFDLKTIDRLNMSYLYSGHEMDKATAKLIYALQCHDEGAFRIPERDELLSLSENGVSFSPEGNSEFMKLIKEYSFRYYYYEDDPAEVSRKAASVLHRSGNTEAAFQIAKRAMTRIFYGKEDEPAYKAIKRIISNELKDLPLMTLNGYSKNNCPKDIKRHVKSMEEERAKEASRRTAYQVNKPAVKKTVAVRKTAKIRKTK